MKDAPLIDVVALFRLNVPQASLNTSAQLNASAPLPSQAGKAAQNAPTAAAKHEEYDAWLKENAISRLLRFAGKKRSEVRNPCFTARETIAIADEIVKWKVAYDSVNRKVNGAVVVCRGIKFPEA